MSVSDGRWRNWIKKYSSATVLFQSLCKLGIETGPVLWAEYRYLYHSTIWFGLSSIQRLCESTSFTRTLTLVICQEAASHKSWIDLLPIAVHISVLTIRESCSRPELRAWHHFVIGEWEIRCIFVCGVGDRCSKAGLSALFSTFHCPSPATPNAT